MIKAKLQGGLYYGYTYTLDIEVSLYNNKRVIGQEETGHRPSPIRSRL
jgi:hypothetical protein